MIVLDHIHSCHRNPGPKLSIAPLLHSTTLNKRDAHNIMSVIASRRTLDSAYHCLRCRCCASGANNAFWSLGLKLAPEKTWVGRAENGFDFLGYRISPTGHSIALGSWNRFTVKLHRLFEQGATMSRRLQYVKHWVRWATSGVSCDCDALLLNIKHIFRTRFNIDGSCLTC